MKENILDLNKWTKVANDWCGIYRYVIAPKCAYEIIVNFYYLDTDILTADASLYVIGMWSKKDNPRTFIERELIAEHKPISELLNCAMNDYKHNF